MAVRHFIDRMLEHPSVYRTWQAPFADQKLAPALRYLKDQPVRRVLDVGCGPGTNASHFEGVEYVGLDINERYLAVARSRSRGRFVQADLATADLSHLGTFDAVLVNSFLHHLPDPAVERILGQIGSLLDGEGRVHVLELVLPDRPALGTVMARLDRGRYARTLGSWVRLLTRHFRPCIVEPYSFGGGLWAMVYFQGGVRTCDSR